MWSLLDIKDFLHKWYWFNQWLSQQSYESCIIDLQIKPQKYLLCNHAKTNSSKGILIKERVKQANDILILSKTLPWIVIPHSHHLECKVSFLHQNDVFLPNTVYLLFRPLTDMYVIYLCMNILKTKLYKQVQCTGDLLRHMHRYLNIASR